MSRLGKKPIKILEGVNVEVGNGDVKVTGKLGSLTLSILEDIDVRVDKDKNDIVVSTEKHYKQARANWGTMRSLLNQSVLGVAQGFAKTLELVGVGYRSSIEGRVLVLNIGFTHQVRFNIPEGITIIVEKTLIKISGINKHLVGQVASSIKKLKKPDPYQGKGIRYQGEVIIKKAGKKAVGAGAK